MKMLSLIISLPTHTSAVRQRTWRTLKSSGAAILRDGVYLMPDRAECAENLECLASDVIAAEGTAHVFRVEVESDESYQALFDRSKEYADLLSLIQLDHQGLSAENAPELQKQMRRIRKSYETIVAIDFFPGEARQQAEAALLALEQDCSRLLSPDEPHARSGQLDRLSLSAFQGRIWATRKRPWVDRMARAWLIRRFIDTQAQILWLDRPQDCPPAALGFDFDDATFSHVANYVTFETLRIRFGLMQPGLTRLGLLVHYLDVGGIAPPEAIGVEKILRGMRDSIQDDDELLRSASTVFDGLFAEFERDTLNIEHT